MRLGLWVFKAREWGGATGQGRSRGPASAGPAPGPVEAGPTSPPRLGSVPRAHARARHAGKAPARRPFCLIGSFLEEALSACEPAEEVGDGVAGVFLAGARAGGSSRPREAP